jgi:hypothetical protein
MRDFAGEELSGLEGAVGQRISDIRLSHRADGAVERLVLMFEDGGSLSIDGRFPASAAMVAAAAELTMMPNAIFERLTCLEESAVRNGGNVTSRTYRADFALQGRVIKTLWTTSEHPEFDVSAQPRLAYRPFEHVHRPGR